MTSSNVSNMLAQVGNDVSVDSFVRGKDVVGGDFAKTLNSLKGDSLGAVSVSATKTVAFSSSVSFSTSAKSTVDSEKNVGNVNNKTSVDTKVVSEKIESVSAKVKEVVKEELGVSDEEIEEAMEVLGLTNIDLFNPQNMAQLVMELQGISESFGLLLDESFKNILDELTVLTEQLLDDIGFTMEELQTIYDGVDIIENHDVSIEFELEHESVGNDDVDLHIQTISDTDAKPVENVNDYDASLVTEDSEDNVEPAVMTRFESENESDDNQQMQNGTANKKTDIDLSDIHQKTDATIVAPESKFDAIFSPDTETISLPTGETVRVQEMINQIVEQAKVLNSEEFTTMEMTLNPEGLGKIFMEVTQKGDEITAKLFAENEVVKEALENQMSNLRTDLNTNTSQKITSIEVTVGAHEFERNLEEDANRQEQSKQEAENYRPKNRSINLNNLDELSGLMTEEEQLVAQIMRENGNTLDYQA